MEGQQHVAREQHLATLAEFKSDSCGRTTVPHSGGQGGTGILDEFNDNATDLLGDEFDSEFLADLWSPAVLAAAPQPFTAAGHADAPNGSHDGQPRSRAPAEVNFCDPSMLQNMVRPD